MTVALIGFAAVLVLAFMRMPLGIALGLVGGFVLVILMIPTMGGNR